MKNITRKFILWGTFNVGLASVNRLSNDLALALIQTSMLFLFKCKLVSIRNNLIYTTKPVRPIKTRPPPASLPFRGQQFTEQTSVKWSISHTHSHTNEILRSNCVVTGGRKCWWLFTLTIVWFHYMFLFYPRLLNLYLPTLTA